MDAESSKSLRCALTEAHITQTLLTRDIEDILNTIRYIMQTKLVQRVIPKTTLVGCTMDRLFRVLISSIVAEPDVVPLFNQRERDDSFKSSETNPYFAVH